MQSSLDCLCLKISLVKDIPVWKKTDTCTGIILPAGSNLFQGIHDLSAFITLAVYHTVLFDRNLQPFGQCIHNGRTYPVKTAGNLISAIAELAPGMKHGKYHFNRRQPRLCINSNRDTTSVIRDYRCSVFLKCDIYFTAVSCQMLVHGIIYDLVNKVVQSFG